jgi:hypothetical protein
MTPGQDSRIGQSDNIARTGKRGAGWPEYNSKNRTAGTGQLRVYNLGRTIMTIQSGQNIWNNWDKTA